MVDQLCKVVRVGIAQQFLRSDSQSRFSTEVALVAGVSVSPRSAMVTAAR